MVIAVDGPAGAGKSTLSKMIAGKLGVAYIDTGAMYRACALRAVSAGVDPAVDSAALRALFSEMSIDFEAGEDGQRVYLNGTDVTAGIREPHISALASAVSAIPFVRDEMVRIQRELAEGKNVLMDGRDIGTNVFPGAEIKIYLTADVRDRARRRYGELSEKGVPVDFENVLREMEERDANDKNRAYAPLKQAGGAKLIDTTGNSLEESCEGVYWYIISEIKAGRILLKPVS
jgi:cytidylate kinase